MGNGLIALMMGAGVGAWVYSKMYSRTGGNNRSSGTVAAVAGVAAAGVMFMVLTMIPE